jgi:hypothetical protein
MVRGLAFSSDGFYLETGQGVMLLQPTAQSTSTLVSQPPLHRGEVADGRCRRDALDTPYQLTTKLALLQFAAARLRLGTALAECYS